MYRPSHPVFFCFFFDHLMLCTCNYETSTWLKSLHGNKSSNKTGQSCTKFLGVWLLNMLSWCTVLKLKTYLVQNMHAGSAFTIYGLEKYKMYKRSCDPGLIHWKGVTQDAIHIACKALSPTPRGQETGLAQDRTGGKPPPFCSYVCCKSKSNK